MTTSADEAQDADPFQRPTRWRKALDLTISFHSWKRKVLNFLVPAAISYSIALNFAQIDAAKELLLALLTGFAAFVLLPAIELAWNFLVRAPLVIAQEEATYYKLLALRLDDIGQQLLEKVNSLSAPQLFGQIEDIWLKRDDGSGTIGVVLAVSIVNRGTPSIARSWQLRIRTVGSADWIKFRQKIRLDHDIHILSPDGTASVSYPPEDSLSEIALASPIANGATIFGILVFEFDPIDWSQLTMPGTEFELTCKDALENERRFTKTWTGGGVGGVRYYPGLHPRVRKLTHGDDVDRS